MYIEDYLIDKTYKPVLDIEQVNKNFEKFLEQCFRCKSEKDKNLITKAFILAKQAHSGQFRYSGDLFIHHSLEVAKITGIDIGLDPDSVAAALLHDVPTETDYNIDDIKFLINEKVATLVDELAKIKGTFEFFNKENIQIYKNRIINLVNDLRVFYIKIADRLHNMRTIFALKPDRQEKIAYETLYVFAPIAEILGLYNIKTELEDLAFKVLNPQKFYEIFNFIKTTHKKSIILLNRASLPIIKRLLEENIDFSIHSRQKGIYSIYRKTQIKKVSLDEIYDIYAMRIIVKPKSPETEKQECYRVAQIIREIYPENKNRWRDWIRNPKNHYEALHLTVKALGKWIEIQIRSERMHDIAEHGIAAHYKYKGYEFDNFIFNEKIKQIKEKIKNFNENLNDEIFKKFFYTSKKVIYTPKLKPIQLPNDATVLDFAFKVHTELGLHFLSAKINNEKTVSYNYVPQTGDIVQIITSSSITAQQSWFEVLKTPEAKKKLREYFNTLEKIDKKRQHPGLRKFQQILKKYNLSNNPKILKNLLKKFKLTNKIELYHKLNSENSFKTELENYISKKATLFKFFYGKSTDKKVILAPCCNPEPSDLVVFIEEDDKIIIHKSTCPQVKHYLETQNKEAADNEIKPYKKLCAVIRLDAKDKFGLLFEIANIFYRDLNLNLKEIDLKTQQHNSENIVKGKIRLQVIDRKHLELIKQKLESIDVIEKIEITILDTE